jgi:hypothetical protein
MPASSEQSLQAQNRQIALRRSGAVAGKAMSVQYWIEPFLENCRILFGSGGRVAEENQDGYETQSQHVRNSTR